MPGSNEIGHFHHGDAELNVLTNSGGGVPQACKADGNPPDEVGMVVSTCNGRRNNTVAAGYVDAGCH